MAPTKINDGHLELVKNTPPKKAAPSPRVISQIEEATVSSCERYLDHMFSAIDDLFYELSKRASSNNEEHLYFESMRELRIKKGGLANYFSQSLKSNFERFIDPRSDLNLPRESGDVDESNLSIVEGDDLEVDLALKGMANRTRESFKVDLYEITIRLDHLLLQITVTEKNNPLDPAQISRAFVDACNQKLKINIKTRLIVFKLFEKHLLKQLGHIYADINQILVETGILPKVPRNLNKSKDAAAVAQEPPSEEEKPEPQAAVLSPPEPSISISQSTLATLMAAIRNSTQGSIYTVPGTDRSGQNNYYFYANNPGPVMKAPDLAKSLSNRQPEYDMALSKAETPKNILPDLVTELLATQNPSNPLALEQPEEDTINLVAHFFDKVLEDENLPIAIQSLICRLQIPILKVAINDSSFLTNVNHPARRLINTITDVGVSLDETKPIEKDPLYKKVAEAVNTINRQYKLDVIVFAQVQSDLEKLINRESKRSAVVEKRTTQTEEGKYKIKHAKSYAQSVLYEKMKDTALHPKISEFLTNTWLQVLVITYIKSGKDSSEWVENEQLVTDLTWLSQVHVDERSKARAQRLKPEILARIESGLEIAVDNLDSRSSIIKNIEDAIKIDGQETGKIERKSLSQEQKEILGKTGSEEKTWEEMTALERQQTRYEELSSKYYQKAKDLPLGTWVRYQDEKQGKIHRCKLSAKIDAESYIFVSRLGFKTLEKTRRQFAYDMQFNKAKILDSSPLFDRVMNNLVNHFSQAATT